MKPDCKFDILNTIIYLYLSLYIASAMVFIIFTRYNVRPLNTLHNLRTVYFLESKYVIKHVSVFEVSDIEIQRPVIHPWIRRKKKNKQQAKTAEVADTRKHTLQIHVTGLLGIALAGLAIKVSITPVRLF